MKYEWEIYCKLSATLQASGEADSLAGAQEACDAAAAERSLDKYRGEIFEAGTDNSWTRFTSRGWHKDGQ